MIIDFISGMTNNFFLKQCPDHTLKEIDMHFNFEEEQLEFDLT